MDCGPAEAEALIHQPAVEPPENQDRLSFSINPRFALACGPDMLTRAKELAGASRWVQTHLAEQTAECDEVRRMWPEAKHYTDVYDAFGLLGPRTLLAHGVHLSDDEWRVIAERGSVIVHCPAANTFLQSGLFDLDAAKKHGIRTALGSDVAAGPDVAMPRVARAMIEVAKMRVMTGATNAPPPTPAEAWRMITRGNAEALGWDDAGTLEVGAAADLLVLRPPFEPDEHFIGRLLHTWEDGYIADRILLGEIVSPEA